MKGYQLDSETREMIKYLAIQESVNKSRLSCGCGRCFGLIVHSTSKTPSGKKSYLETDRLSEPPVRNIICEQ